jgi:hypothetical protein
MNKAVCTTASLLGISAGIAGLEHGYFELLQGHTRPDGLFIAYIGPPCQPELIWNNCEPALTIIPGLFLQRILDDLHGHQCAVHHGIFAFGGLQLLCP